MHISSEGFRYVNKLTEPVTVKRFITTYKERLWLL